MYRTLFYVDIYGSFKLSKNRPFFGPPCTSGFMDDVTFGHTGPYGDMWKAEPVTYYPSRRGDTGAESDVYECLVETVVGHVCVSPWCWPWQLIECSQTWFEITQILPIIDLCHTISSEVCCRFV